MQRSYLFSNTNLSLEGLFCGGNLGFKFIHFTFWAITHIANFLRRNSIEQLKHLNFKTWIQLWTQHFMNRKSSIDHIQSLGFPLPLHSRYFASSRSLNPDWLAPILASIPRHDLITPVQDWIIIRSRITGNYMTANDKKKYSLHTFSFNIKIKFNFVSIFVSYLKLHCLMNLLLSHFTLPLSIQM